MDKQEILEEIRRQSEGRRRAIGAKRFRRATGIHETEWRKHWSDWSAALTEAGLPVNRTMLRYEPEDLAKSFLEFVGRLGRVPSHSEILEESTTGRLACLVTYRRHFGNRGEMLEAMEGFARAWPEFTGLGQILREAIIKGPDRRSGSHGWEPSIPAIDGLRRFTRDAEHIYLVKAGDEFYKIGRAANVKSRVKVIATCCPFPTELVHTIATDDPVRIERYWHDRFEAFHVRGEWFRLGPEEVAAFGKRTFK